MTVSADADKLGVRRGAGWLLMLHLFLVLYVAQQPLDHDEVKRSLLIQAFGEGAAAGSCCAAVSALAVFPSCVGLSPALQAQLRL